MTGFTDEVLAATRTTRLYSDPWRDGPTEVIPGDLLLVDVSAYHGGIDPLQWCPLTSIAPGAAAPYPYRVRVPGRGVGQYAANEILAWARPLHQHEIHRELRLIHGIPRAS